jgi:pyrroline-5-carboxylate reductase
MDTKKIAFLGCGNMGSAIVNALLQKEKVFPDHMYICDTNPEKLKVFQHEGIHVSQVAEETVASADIVFLAVKPQGVEKILNMLKGSFVPETLLVSIAAGVTISKLKQYSGLQKVIRTLPNTPAMVHLGVTQMYTPDEVSQEEKSYITDLLESFSLVITCKDEDELDKYGTISACGPAYFFRILEIFSRRAEQFGLSAENARALTLRTMLGSAQLAAKSGEDFSVLRQKVTSKGGNTEQALETFDRMKLEEILNAGIDAALRRTKQLGE